MENNFSKKSLVYSIFIIIFAAQSRKGPLPDYSMLVMTPGSLFLFIFLTLKHFPKNSCFFQKKSVSLQKISCTRQSVSKLTLRSFA